MRARCGYGNSAATPPQKAVAVDYVFKASETFWKNFYALTAEQKEATRNAWQIFKSDPFDPRLKPHKIHRLSAKVGQTIYSIVIMGDLRSLFYLSGDIVYSFDIGSHDVYR